MTETPDRFTWSPGEIEWDNDDSDDDNDNEDMGDHLSDEDMIDTSQRRVEKAGVPTVADTPGDERAAERLRHYWAHGEGAAKIGWGTPGDFDRCVHHVGKYMKDPKGYCNLRHHEALGYYPATHAAMERGHKGEEPALVKGYYPDASELLDMVMGLLEEYED